MLEDRLVVRLDRESAATADGAWPATLDGDHLDPLDAMVGAIDPHLRCEAISDGDALVIEVVQRAGETPESDDVVLTRFSTGVTHRFEPRGTPVEIRPFGPVVGSPMGTAGGPDSRLDPGTGNHPVRN
jgi:hypothetical protein